MKLKLKRVYEQPDASDGIRILVERLWPRGLSKEKAKVDLWIKDAAPSTELRKWFDHDPKKWEVFKKRYYSELTHKPEALKPVLELRDQKEVTFVYASKEERYNNAQALVEYITKLRV